MDNDTNGSEHDKNKQQGNNEEEKKKDTDRQAIVKDSEYIIYILKKFPIFKGLTYYQYKKILKIWSLKKFQTDQYVCEKIDKSYDIYILVDGKLKVMYHEKTLLTYISPISLVGELFIFTGEQGFSTVIATKESSVIMIEKNKLFDLLKQDRLIGYCIQMNIISELANKLRKSNEIIDDLRKKTPQS